MSQYDYSKKKNIYLPLIQFYNLVNDKEVNYYLCHHLCNLYIYLFAVRFMIKSTHRSSFQKAGIIKYIVDRKI